MTPAQTTQPADRPPAEPSSETLETAKRAASRARKVAQLRLRFIAREDPSAPPPPLAQMLRGGRGGDVRLKLFLTFLWFQTDGTHAVPLEYPAQLWAQLLGLEDPPGHGARRINQAQRWLEKHDFIQIQAQPGHANRIIVLEESGDGASPYAPPGRLTNRLRDDPEQQRRHLYAQLPAELWTHGYMALLKGAALACYLILLDQHGPGKVAAERPVWISPKLFKDRYGLSDDTRAKGMRELRAHGLVTITRKRVNPHDFDLERIRNTYTLNPDVLQRPAHRMSADFDGLHEFLQGVTEGFGKLT